MLFLINKTAVPSSLICIPQQRYTAQFCLSTLQEPTDICPVPAYCIQLIKHRTVKGRGNGILPCHREEPVLEPQVSFSLGQPKLDCQKWLLILLWLLYLVDGNSKLPRKIHVSETTTPHHTLDNGHLQLVYVCSPRTHFAPLIPMSLGLNKMGFESWEGRGNFLFSETPRSDLCPTQPHI